MPSKKESSTTEFLALTEDHKPTLPAEKSRITRAGGFVDMDRVVGFVAILLDEFSIIEIVSFSPGFDSSALSCLWRLGL